MNRLILVTLYCGILSGCFGSSGTADRPKLYKTEGVVLYRDKPLAGASVAFRAVEGEISAFGQTDEQGHYELTTFDTADGAPAGKYNVVIQAYEQQPPTGTAEGDQYVPPTSLPQPPKLLTPRAYLLSDTTPLKVTVSPTEKNVFELVLHD